MMSYKVGILHQQDKSIQCEYLSLNLVVTKLKISQKKTQSKLKLIQNKYLNVIKYDLMAYLKLWNKLKRVKKILTNKNLSFFQQ